MIANQMQVGGSHYKTDYEHWDWAINIRLGYLESAATKYVTRWRSKNGVQDVEKAIHYLTKMKEVYLEGRYPNRSFFQDSKYHEYASHQTRLWLKENSISGIEAEFMWTSASWKNDVDISLAIGKARQVLDMAVAHSEDVQQRVGRAGGRVGQGAASSASTEPSERSGINHPAPFGYNEECKTCNGLGLISFLGDENDCPFCDGTGISQ